MKLHIALLPGDGIGPEVCAGAMLVLRAIAERYGHTLHIHENAIGWDAIQRFNAPLPQETLATCLRADAVLLGAVGGPPPTNDRPSLRPEAGLLELRQQLGCFANLRPARIVPGLVDRSPLRREIVEDADLVIVRELAGGIYYGEQYEDAVTRVSGQTMTYSAGEIARVAGVAFDLARQRGRRVTSVDKANVLCVSRLWRAVVDEVSRDYPDVTCEHMLVDRAAMELVFRPDQFDVMLTANMFGDILSDEAAAITGSIGMLPSASIGGKTDLYEPVHGSAPEIAGRGAANPSGAILSTAMMLRTTFGLHAEANTIEAAVETVLDRGIRTADIALDGKATVGTTVFADAVASLCTEHGSAVAASTQSTDASPGKA